MHATIRLCLDIHLPMPASNEATRERVDRCSDTLIETAAALAARGWMPATSGNLSIRLDDTHVAITTSGQDKSQLTRADLAVVGIVDGHAVDATRKPSAETPLHVQLYQRLAAVGSVLHTHSQSQSVASRVFAHDGILRLQGWELQKALRGFDTHASVLELPVFPNTQRLQELVARVDAWIDDGKALHGYLVEGHGMYAWGHDTQEARRHLEALDFLLACELDLRRLTR